jgi:hypothetical protein
MPRGAETVSERSAHRTGLRARPQRRARAHPIDHRPDIAHRPDVQRNQSPHESFQLIRITDSPMAPRTDLAGDDIAHTIALPFPEQLIQVFIQQLILRTAAMNRCFFKTDPDRASQDRGQRIQAMAGYDVTDLDVGFWPSTGRIAHRHEHGVGIGLQRPTAKAAMFVVHRPSNTCVLRVRCGASG